jgi:hypothetical protein
MIVKVVLLFKEKNNKPINVNFLALRLAYCSAIAKHPGLHEGL